LGLKLNIEEELDDKASMITEDRLRKFNELLGIENDGEEEYINEYDD
jgi:hypothetical protein